MEACQELCLQELGDEGCKGVEYNKFSLRCEIWKRPEGIWAFDYPKWEGFQTLQMSFLLQTLHLLFDVFFVDSQMSLA